MQDFKRISVNAFNELQLDAGVLLYHFDLANGTFKDEDIITATTGGITVACTPTFSDFAEDVDNAPNNMMEFKHLDNWVCRISTTALGTSPESIRMALGAADINATTGAIKPRAKVSRSDFRDIWWGGNKANGGFVVAHLKNSLSTDGFQLKTTKNGKGQTTFTLTGHVSIRKQDDMPIEFYSKDPTGTYSISADPGITNGSLTFTVNPTTRATGSASTVAEVGDYVKVTATPESGYELDTLSAVDANDNIVVIDGSNFFVMPESDVVVNAEFVSTTV